MESRIRVPNIANSSKQGMEELDASMPYFADLLRMVPRIPSQMSNLLVPSILQSPPPDAFILTDQEDIYIGEPVPTICETPTSVSSTPLTNVTNNQTSATSSMTSAPLTNGTTSQTSVQHSFAHNYVARNTKFPIFAYNVLSFI